MTWEQGFDMRNQVGQGVQRLDQRPEAFVPPRCSSYLWFWGRDSLLQSEMDLCSSNEQ